MAGYFDFLHIKRHTEGSSNELSVDVLEHKSNEADGRKTLSSSIASAAQRSKRDSSGDSKQARGAVRNSAEPKGGARGKASKKKERAKKPVREAGATGASVSGAAAKGVSATVASASGAAATGVFEEKRGRDREPKASPAALHQAGRAATRSVARPSTLGPGQPATLSGQSEVARRKERRRASRAHVRIVIGAVVLVAVGVAVFFGLKFHEQRLDNSAKIENLIERLAVVDETLARADSLMVDPLSDDGADDRASVLKETPNLVTELNRIEVDAQTLLSSQLDEKETLTTKQVGEAAHGRAEMFDAATQAFELSKEAFEQEEQANRVWNNVVGTDQLAREAIVDANKATTQDATNQSLDKMRQALSEFEESSTALKEFKRSCPADFSSQEGFLDKKIEALGFGIATSEALLAGNREEAEKANDSYNAADTAAVRIAEGLPATMGEVVISTYEVKIEELRQLYDESRTRVIQADSTIREFLAH